VAVGKVEAAVAKAKAVAEVMAVAVAKVTTTETKRRRTTSLAVAKVATTETSQRRRTTARRTEKELRTRESGRQERTGPLATRPQQARKTTLCIAWEVCWSPRTLEVVCG
jgi:hypothetical protein